MKKTQWVVLRPMSKILIAKGYPIEDAQRYLVDIYREFECIPKNSKVYLTSKIDHDFFIDGSKIKALSLLDDITSEWSIWSKCFGKVFVFNGVSSTGKTTLINYLSKFGFNKVSLDDVSIDFFFNIVSNKIHEFLLAQKFLSHSDLCKILFGLKVNKDKYQPNQKDVIEKLESVVPTILKDYLIDDDTISKINDAVWHKIQESIASGENVIVDAVIHSNQVMGKFSYDLRYYPISVVLVYSSLAENLKKCFSRNNFSLENDLCDYRLPAQIIYQYLLFYTFTVNKDKETVISDKHIKFLEKVDLDKTHNSLEESRQHSTFLLEHLYSKDDPHYLHGVNALTESTGKISKILNHGSEVFVLPSVEFHHLIKTENLKMIDREYSIETKQEILVMLSEMLGESNDFVD